MKYADKDLWSLVLAGGEGARMKPFIKRWLGRHKPKQYCTFIGTRSMFQHTLDRSDQIVAPERRVTVIARAHRNEAFSQLSSRATGKVILQPSNRETAAGIFLGLTYIRKRDPDSTVVIFPSDHFAHPEDRFVEMTYSMACAAKQMKHWVFLMGVSPYHPEPEYGWIHPGGLLGWFDGCRMRATKALLEKPDRQACKTAMDSGALWNSMVMAAQIETLWSLGLHAFPEMMRLFEIYSESIGGAQEDLVLEDVYQAMPRRNFSSHLLQASPQHIAVMELRKVLWSDWGKPERIFETLRHIGRKPKVFWTRMAASAG